MMSMREQRGAGPSREEKVPGQLGSLHSDWLEFSQVSPELTPHGQISAKAWVAKGKEYEKVEEANDC